MRWQGASKRTYTGGKRIDSRKKRKFEIGREFAETRIGPAKSKNVPTRGGNRKVRLLSDNFINVTDPKTGKTQRVTAEKVMENSANKHYIRRNIITKGTIVRTDAGLVKVTSRPGQSGVINAVLLEEQE
ncbi:30S ribosomal protein S8e [Methanimicrococcus sp. OttesenSCG-928-J09]|nr:30S ribosomal protein S8e [Methanimicrococcus sp. OttesenSCG-928-J09]